MAFKRRKNPSVRPLGDAGARQDYDVQARQNTLVAAKAFPNQTLQAVARNRRLHIFLPDGEAELWSGPFIIARDHQKTAITGFEPTGILEDTLKSGAASEA